MWVKNLMIYLFWSETFESSSWQFCKCSIIRSKNCHCFSIFESFNQAKIWDNFDQCGEIFVSNCNVNYIFSRFISLGNRLSMMNSLVMNSLVMNRVVIISIMGIILVIEQFWYWWYQKISIKKNIPLIGYFSMKKKRFQECLT